MSDINMEELSRSYVKFIRLFANAEPTRINYTHVGPSHVLAKIHDYSRHAHIDATVWSWRLHDTVYHMTQEQRIAMIYRYCGIGKQFIDACVWLWVLYEGRELYLQQNGHYPVDMTKFAWLAFNNDWDDLQPLLEMEI